MGYSQIDSVEFTSLFSSNEQAYGVTIVGEMVNGKAEAKSHLEHQALKPTVLKAHLEGKLSIGAAPLKAGNVVRWCAIDIDNYEGRLLNIVEAIEDFDIPLLPCYSKSRKLHLYCFFKEDTPAEDAINLMKWYASNFRCDSKVEIFPKQSKMSASNKFYSWINLPYFDAASDNHRKCVRKDGSLMSLSDFIERAQNNQLTFTEHMERMKELPYYGSPPCVQSGVLLRDLPPGTRNNWFYNVACYLRMGDEEAEITDPLLELNDTLHTPLPESEIRNTVAKVASRSYFYQCAGMIGCNKQMCRNSEKGIGSNESTQFSFGQLTKVMTDPIQWEWEINGTTLRFHDTNQIMNQNEFRRQCMERINSMPFKVKEEKWTSIIRRALDNLVEKQEDIYGNFGVGSQFLKALSDYFSGASRTGYSNAEVVEHGKTYKVDDRVRFNSDNILLYITEKCDIKISQAGIRERLIDMGAIHEEGVVWSLPVEKIHFRKVETPNIDYHDEEGDSYAF